MKLVIPPKLVKIISHSIMKMSQNIRVTERKKYRDKRKEKKTLETKMGFIIDLQKKKTFLKSS